MNALPLSVPFQERVRTWILKCFGLEVAGDMVERGDRLLEEVLELLQAHGYDASRIPGLVEYTYGRPAGEPRQEVGGVMVTLAAYCGAAGIDMHSAGEVELARVWTRIDQIRAKQAAKPRNLGAACMGAGRILKGNADLVPYCHPLVLADGRVPCDACDAAISKDEAERNAVMWDRAVCDRCARDIAEANPGWRARGEDGHG